MNGDLPYFSSSVTTLFFLHVFAITGSFFMWFSVGFFLELVLECVPGDLRSVLCGTLSLNFLLHFFKVFYIT